MKAVELIFRVWHCCRSGCHRWRYFYVIWSLLFVKYAVGSVVSRLAVLTVRRILTRNERS